MKPKKCLSLLTDAEYVHKRQAKGRKIIMACRYENAQQAIGELYPGCEIYGFTKGQFSLIDIIEHCLAQVGPADIVVSTWSAAAGDISAANRLLREDKIKSLRFLIDASFKSRKPEFCQQLLDTFGADCIRVSSVHAKFATIQAEEYSLVVRTSMNLNNNPRFENFEISDDPAMMGFMQEIIEEIWRTQETHAGFDSTRSGNDREFAKLFAPSGLVSAGASDLVTGKL
jgi:hypothetical protein